MNSMSFSATPARSAIAIPSPVHAYAFVVARYARPTPPVASTTVLRADRLDAAVEQVPADDALTAAVLDHELVGEELLVDLDVALHHLLVEHVDEHVAGDVGRIDGSRRAGGPERALGELAVGRAREDAAPVLELVDVAGRLPGEDLDRVLVAEVVRALDGVEGVLLGTVLGCVPERRVDAALGGSRVTPSRVELRDEGDVGAGVECLDRRPHSGAAGADDEDVVLRFHRLRPYRKRPVGLPSQHRVKGIGCEA